ncbi:HD-GYP domain-containing protein [bacterium]|nr:HD-GYP domain-containing protein [bacterium]
MNRHNSNNDTQNDTIRLETGQGASADLRHEGNFEQMKQNLTVLYDRKVERWLRAMDLYDREITEHTLRVTALSLQLAQAMNFSADQLEFIQYGTLLHDIGKLGIPEKIMQKPGKLTTFEYQVVQQHPLYAHEWLIHRPAFEPAKVIPLYHHERWDGTGYPYGLKGKEIPVLARVVAVSDVWDAITSDRPYRKAMSQDQALSLIHSKSGTHFDPEVVDAFLSVGLHEEQKVPCTFPVYV